VLDQWPIQPLNVPPPSLALSHRGHRTYRCRSARPRRGAGTEARPLAIGSTPTKTRTLQCEEEGAGRRVVGWYESRGPWWEKGHWRGEAHWQCERGAASHKSDPIALASLPASPCVSQEGTPGQAPVMPAVPAGPVRAGRPAMRVACAVYGDGGDSDCRAEVERHAQSARPTAVARVARLNGAPAQ